MTFNQVKFCRITGKIDGMQWGRGDDTRKQRKLHSMEIMQTAGQTCWIIFFLPMYD